MTDLKSKILKAASYKTFAGEDYDLGTARQQVFSELLPLIEALAECVDSFESVKSVENIKTISDCDEEEWWYSSSQVDEIVDEALAKLEGMVGK